MAVTSERATSERHIAQRGVNGANDGRVTCTSWRRNPVWTAGPGHGPPRRSCRALSVRWRPRVRVRVMSRPCG